MNRMKGHWWSRFLCLLCMPAEVILNTWTVFQSPSSISHMKVNSSTEITCSTSSRDVMGFYLRGQFHDKRSIVYLSINKGEVTKNTTAAEFQGRLQILPNKNVKQGLEFTFTLSLLGLDDTDLYYCEWSHLNSQLVLESRSSDGTILIIREYDPQEQCKLQTLVHVLISMSVAVFVVILFLFIVTVVMKCRRFKKHFRPARTAPPRPNRPQHVCPQQSVQHYPYWITSENNLEYQGHSAMIARGVATVQHSEYHGGVERNTRGIS